MAAVFVNSLLLSAFASLSARLFRTPASRSPGGTPPSSASHAGTPHSCHTCGGEETRDITVLARPLNSPPPSFDADEEQLPVFTKEQPSHPFFSHR